MTKCYDCGKAFTLQPNEIVGLIGWGDYIIEEDDNMHVLVNIVSDRAFILEYINA